MARIAPHRDSRIGGTIHRACMLESAAALLDKEHRITVLMSGLVGGVDQWEAVEHALYVERAWKSLLKNVALAVTIAYIVHQLVRWNGSQRKLTAAQRPPPSGSEPERARAIDLSLLGHLLAARLAADGVLAQRSQFARLWNQHVVPQALSEGAEWRLGMTSRIGGLTSAKAFNGRIARISSRTPSDGRWELLVVGPDGIGTVNLKPANLMAPMDLADVIEAWRSIPNASSLPAAHEPKASTVCLPCDPPAPRGALGGP